LHIGFELWIKPNNDIGELKNKAVIVNSLGVFQGGTWDGTYVKANPKALGSFYVTIDTIAPKIIPINMSKGKNMQNEKRISFNISDNLSGIKSFDGFVDGQWILMKFDAKSNTLWYDFDERVSTGAHNFQLTVVDLKENSRTYRVDFYK
ncbi:MAG: M23 family peptidase, partial [Sphingobacteriaceae bacterium]|nr:M23 family peptidase [Sphingobacteriaceae bacterium]